MGAPKGNDYGRVWTEEKALALMDKAIFLAKSDPEIKTLVTLATKLETYETVFTYLSSEYKAFAVKKAQLLKILANNIINDSLNNKTNTTMSIFVLKNHHGYSDKKDVDITSQGEKIQSNVFLLPEIEGDEEE